MSSLILADEPERLITVDVIPLQLNAHPAVHTVVCFSPTVRLTRLPVRERHRAAVRQHVHTFLRRVRQRKPYARIIVV